MGLLQWAGAVTGGPKSKISYKDSGVGAWTEWTDWTYRDGFMDVFKKVDVSVHTSMCDGRMGRIWTYPSIKNGRNGRIKDELFA